MKVPASLGVFGACLFLGWSVVSGETLYVAIDGKDSNLGTKETAWATPQKAVLDLASPVEWAAAGVSQFLGPIRRSYVI
ncbi:MAG: hypothetical protein ACYTG0_36810 [Planctomycetota bacterium]|jgi:hypothetical protein